MNDDTEISRKRASARKAKHFFWACSGMVILVVAILAYAAQFEFFGGGGHVMFAMLAGVVVTVLLGVGLMALAFHSDDSGIDDQQ